MINDVKTPHEWPSDACVQKLLRPERCVCTVRRIIDEAMVRDDAHTEILDIYKSR